MKKKYVILFGTGIFVLIVIILICSFSTSEKADLTNFAKCLTEKGIKMYGTGWCPHCKDQKEMFGDSFKFIDYTDCDQNKDLCLIEEIGGYPTWKIDDESYPGTQSLDTLSIIAGCDLE